MFFIPTKVNIESMKINSASHKCAVSVGPTFLKNINVAGKKNQGFGQQMADFSIAAVPINIVFDDEIIDIPSMKRNHA
ncbi:hypothetical protein QNH20_13475 [Neobacillus sp. WH10]|uniref:hypothetical protein n=1 Tax=Neobacillus sp. WH10 TaxID=3047873 RepID=UPI0024C14F3C|nr:hypothetical protein [Neobacillus sp. WH10]WHY75162.1 hypothetical protein QNH20_13475 [Neobacillus sp. WH10]